MHPDGFEHVSRPYARLANMGHVQLLAGGPDRLAALTQAFPRRKTGTASDAVTFVASVLEHESRRH